MLEFNTEKRFIFFAEKTGQHYEILIRDRMGEEYIITDDFFRSKDVVWEIKDLLNVMNDTLLEQAKQVSKLSEENEQLRQENEYLKKRIELISDELYCKDRKLEELGVPIECCDKK